MATAGEFCNRTVYTVRKTDRLLDAARQMREQHVGDLVVVEDRAGRAVPIGMVTDRDIVVAVVAKSPDHLATLQVGDIMDERLYVAHEDEALEDVSKRMRAAGVRRMPVVDRDGALVGIVTFDDLLALIAENVSDLARLLSRSQEHEQERRP